MSEIALNVPQVSVLAKESVRLPQIITVYHQTRKEHVTSIMQDGLRLGERQKGNTIWGKADKLIDFYCRLFGTRVNRSNSIYASLEDPRFKDVDNNASFDKNIYAVISVAVGSDKAYVAESEYYAQALANLGTLSFVKAHVEAIKYVRSIQKYEEYIKNGPKHFGTFSYSSKPEVLISKSIPPNALKVL